MRRAVRLSETRCRSPIWGRLAFVAALFGGTIFLPPYSYAAKECTLKRLMEAPLLTGNYVRPTISVMLDGKPRKVLLDTGGFWSLVTPETAAGLPRYRSPLTGSLGARGRKMSELVKMSLQLGAAKIDGVEFFVSPEGYADDIDATLGANWLAQFDVEIDPVKNTASLFSHDHCEGQVVYWPHQDYAEIPFDVVRGERRITLPLVLAGKKVKVLVDTGAPDSVLSLKAAARLFDLTPDSPGMQPYGFSTDDQGRKYKRYRYQFSSLEMGDIAFKNAWITIEDLATESEDMILGMHQLGALHLYFAYDEEKLYATSARGDIAARGEAPVTGAGGTHPPSEDPLARINATSLVTEAVMKLRKGDRDGALATIEQAVKTDPGYSETYRIRGDIHLTRGEREPAFKDFAHALELDPADLDAYADRAQFEWQTGNKTQAMSDIALALGHNPDFGRGYQLRAGFETSNHDWNGALADAGQLIRLQPSRAEGYTLRAQLYAASGDVAHAYDDQTIAVKLAPKSAVALNNRCWFGAILGKLDDALDDCDAALDIAPKDPAALDSRGFVRLKKGQWDRAIKDYTAALEAKSDMASSLYGRGQAKEQKGDKPGADADIAAAEKIDKNIAQHFGK